MRAGVKHKPELQCMDSWIVPGTCQARATSIPGLRVDLRASIRTFSQGYAPFSFKEDPKSTPKILRVAPILPPFSRIFSRWNQLRVHKSLILVTAFDEKPPRLTPKTNSVRLGAAEGNGGHIKTGCPHICGTLLSVTCNTVPHSPPMMR